ncbi:MAG: 1-acyl-sn-glycerol-3-phosphate acyltransferase [Myxococcota bacterium]|jgi:1-acyl-sn-glycerol-3-phosphate acyltransferase
MKRSRPVLEASAENKLKVENRVHRLIPAFQGMLWPWHRITSEGWENVPRTGPVLVLSNHVSMLDPITLIIAARRQIHFLATRSLMQERGVSRIMQIAAVVPRKKFAADMKSIRRLKAWGDEGAAVGLFPEGIRTWDGHNNEVLPGIEKLIRLMGMPVVTARLINAYRQAPRWGAAMRHGRVHVQFDPPRVFGRTRADLKEIRRYVVERIQVEPAEGWPVWGRRLAEGVENVLYACPSCGVVEGLRSSGNSTTCRSCGASWRVDSENVLHGSDGALTLDEALARQAERISETWIADADLHRRNGTILISDPATLFDVTGDEMQTITTGRLQLTDEAMSMLGPDGVASWSVPLPDVKVATVDMRRRLQFRTSEQAIELSMPEESVVKWVHFVNHWRGQG